MSKIKTVNLGVYQILFGVANDPERIKKLVRDFRHYLDSGLDPDRFADRGEPIRKGMGIVNWPVGEEGVKPKKVQLQVVCFGKYLPNYEAVLNEAASLPSNMKKAGFPHLATQFSLDKVRVLWKRNVPWIAAPDEASLWRDGDGQLYVPYVHCNPRCRDLGAGWVGHGWGENGSFLFFSE